MSPCCLCNSIACCKDCYRCLAALQVSKACTSICMWVRAMHLYHTVALGVAPKRAALAAAQESLDNTMAQLADAQAKLQVSQEQSPVHTKNFTSVMPCHAQGSSCTDRMPLPWMSCSLLCPASLEQQQAGPATITYQI